EFGESGSPEAQKRLAESLEKALKGLSEEERKKLAENLNKRLEEQQKQGQSGVQPLTKQQIEDLAKKLGTPEGQKQLEEQLRDLARQDPSGDAQKEQSLDDAERGGAEAQQGLGAMPIPMQGESGG